MRTIDMQTWSRRQHFELFSTYDYPYFGMCANVDLTAFVPAVKQQGYSLTAAIVYVITQASNAIPEFRYRIREGGGLLKMPLGVQGHHALMDGVHAGKFYAKVQDYLRQPEVILGDA